MMDARTAFILHVSSMERPLWLHELTNDEIDELCAAILTTTRDRLALDHAREMEEAVAKERERCAVIAEEHQCERTGSMADLAARATAQAIAAAIREGNHEHG